MLPTRILLLAPLSTPLNEILRNAGYEVFGTDAPIDDMFVNTGRFDFLISYGYRHILKADILDLFSGMAINMHISFLPFNRGADPNFWSLYEGTARGVTIHYMNEGIDTGDIIVQKKVIFDDAADTLETSYNKLHDAMMQLFIDNMDSILSGECSSFKQPGKGTYHNSSDKEALFNQLKAKRQNIWDTPIGEVIEIGNALRG